MENGRTSSLRCISVAVSMHKSLPSRALPSNLDSAGRRRATSGRHVPSVEQRSSNGLPVDRCRVSDFDESRGKSRPTDEDELPERGDLGQPVEFDPLAHLIVGHGQHAQFPHDADALQFVDLVVRDPQLLQRVGHRLLQKMEDDSFVLADNLIAILKHGHTSLEICLWFMAITDCRVLD